jgi:NitT/TauT family transport system substrate-binding protein
MALSCITAEDVLKTVKEKNVQIDRRSRRSCCYPPRHECRTDPAIFDAAWTASLPSYPLTPRIEAAGVDKNITFMNAVEVEPVRIAADQVFTNAIVDAVAPHMSRYPPASVKGKPRTRLS